MLSQVIAAPNGGHLYVESNGRGESVVLIHGGQLDRRMWDAEFDDLARDYHVIRYDVRGFGRSPAGPTDAFRSYEDLEAILDSLGIRRCSIIGLSLGGRIAIDFAIAHPDRVDRLVLLAPGVWAMLFCSDVAIRRCPASAAREHAAARRTSDRDAMEGATARAAELSAELHSVNAAIRAFDPPTA